MKVGPAVVVSLLAAPAALAGAPDTLLYAQTPLPFRGYESSVVTSAAFPSQRMVETIAPPFGLVLPALVYRIDWWGGVDSGNGFDLSNIESFDITALELFSGDVLLNRTVSIDELNPTLEFGNEGSPDPAIYRFSYSVDSFPALFGSNAGMLSIAANYVDGAAGRPRFLWAISGEGDGELFFSGNGGSVIPFQTANPNVAYALYGALPTPGAASLLALAGVAGTRRRRCPGAGPKA